MGRVMSPILSDLNRKQQEAVVHWGSPLLILAGAGSGKTRVLTHRAAWFITEKGIPAEDILMLTFTNKASGEMRERINKLSSSSPASPWAGTFHSFCVRVLRQDGAQISISPSFAIYDDSDNLDALKEVALRLGLDKNFKVQIASSSISSSKNELIDCLEYSNFAVGEKQKQIAVLFREYQKLLKENNALDFDDLLFFTVKLFENKEILEKYRNRFPFVLVDEWQDTNKAQYQIVKFLAGRDRNLTVVGDASQSIYSWRGANYRNLIYLKKDFPDLTTINLEQNYRSTQTILDASYSVISKNTSHPILKLWTDNGSGERIKLYQAKSELDEASFIANEIEGAVAAGASYSDFAVLYRVNAQSRVLEEALLPRSIPYILVGGVRFYARAEIKDLISYLRLLVNPKDSVSKKRVLGLGKKRFEKFEEYFLSLNIATSATLEILDGVCQATSFLERFDPENEEDLGRLENIKELRSVAGQFSNIFEFLEQVALVESLNPSTSSGQDDFSGKVTLMTAHSAKGLEFPVVFMVGLEDGIFPHSRSLFDGEELEEERRLAYVGMTRAKRALYLTFATRRLIFGQRGFGVPSRFLADIPENLIENVDTYDDTA